MRSAVYTALGKSHWFSSYAFSHTHTHTHTALLFLDDNQQALCCRSNKSFFFTTSACTLLESSPSEGMRAQDKYKANVRESRHAIAHCGYSLYRDKIEEIIKHG